MIIFVISLIIVFIYCLYKFQKENKTLKEYINTQTKLVENFQSTAEELQEKAEERANQVYEAKTANLQEEYSSLLLSLDKKKNELENKIKDLEDNQNSILEAQLQEAKKKANIDFYRLVLPQEDIEDVRILREFQKQLTHKEAIDKVIWDVYYKTAYDTLMPHLFDSSSKICGIYKLTNLVTGQAYVGQSADIKERMRQHLKTALSAVPTTNKLYRSMKQYGPENFTFEVLESKVARNKLNEREAYWIDFYKTKEIGLNSTRGNGV